MTLPAAVAQTARTADIVVRRAFLQVMDVLCGGLVVGTWTEIDGATGPALFDTREDAEADLAEDYAGLDPADREAGDEGDDEGGADDLGLFVTPVAILADGTYVLSEVSRRWTAADIAGMR